MSDNFIDPEKVDGGGVDPCGGQPRVGFGAGQDLFFRIAQNGATAAKDARADKLTGRDGRVEGVDR